jgi:DNA-binding transcriptional regulator YhcF (GntR family)
MPLKPGAVSDQYLGDIISLQTANETNIVVNTIELAHELLEKQAAVTANRPRNVMVQEM